MTTPMHEPTPEFAQFLEWQVASAVRRHDRFAEPVRSYGYAKYLAAAAVIVAAMMIGAGGVAAAGRIQDNQQKQLLLTEQNTQIQLAQLQLSLAQKALEDAQRRVNVGTAAAGIAESAARDVRIAQVRLDRAKLDAVEVEMSSRPVHDEVTAPTVKSRDFVMERLELELKAAGIALTSAESNSKNAHTRYEVGLLGDVELAEADNAMARAQSNVSAIQDQIALRSRFLSGGLTAPQAVQQKALLMARAELKLAESALELAIKRTELLKKKAAIGAVDERDALSAQLDILTRRADIAALQARVRQLERGGSEQTPDLPVQK